MIQQTERTTADGVPVELAGERKIRYRNKLHYRFSHWPIWIFVFFIVPWPLTFDLFESGFDRRMAVWLGVVLVGTGVAGVRGRLPGCERRPYIIRFTEDRPNPLYRRVCYTFAWSAVVSFGALHIAGLVAAIVTGVWNIRPMYAFGYYPLAIVVWVFVIKRKSDFDEQANLPLEDADRERANKPDAGESKDREHES